MITGKSKGLKKGDFIWTGAFPGIIISDVHTFAPCCEVWGMYQEMGSAYAKEMTKISKETFLTMAHSQGHETIEARSKVGKLALGGGV